MTNFEPEVTQFIDKIMTFYREEALPNVEDTFLERHVTDAVQKNWEEHEYVYITDEQFINCLKKANADTLEDGWKRLQEGGYLDENRMNTLKGSEMVEIFHKNPQDLTDDELEKIKTFHGVMEVIKEFWESEGKR